MVPAVACSSSIPRSLRQHRCRPAIYDWMMRFQFDGDVDYFEIDPVAYAPALQVRDGGLSSATLRYTGFGPRPSAEDLWTSRHAHEWFMIEWNARRLAVLDRDIDAIVCTHARDRSVAAWLEDTAEAFEEIGEIDLALDWAKQATEFDRGHQSLKVAGYWCRLLAEHRPAELLPARLEVFRRWPSSSTAAYLYQDAGPSWPSHRDEVATLAASPRDAVLFALLTLKEVQFAWKLAFSLGLDSDDVGAAGHGVREGRPARRAAARPARRERTDGGRRAALPDRPRRLAKMRKRATGSRRQGLNEFIAELRETHRRRPRLQQEFDRAGLP